MPCTVLSGLFFLTLEDKFICLFTLFYKNVYFLICVVSSCIDANV